VVPPVVPASAGPVVTPMLMAVTAAAGLVRREWAGAAVAYRPDDPGDGSGGRGQHLDTGFAQGGEGAMADAVADDRVGLMGGQEREVVAGAAMVVTLGIGYDAAAVRIDVDERKKRCGTEVVAGL